MRCRTAAQGIARGAAPDGRKMAVHRMAGAGMAQSTCLCGEKSGERRRRGGEKRACAGMAACVGRRGEREAGRAIGEIVKRQRKPSRRSASTAARVRRGVRGLSCGIGRRRASRRGSADGTQLDTSVSQATPDHLLRVLHHRVDQPATDRRGYMPGFGDAFDDRQMAELAAYIRARYAPGQPAWRNVAQASARIRQAGAH